MFYDAVIEADDSFSGFLGRLATGCQLAK